MKDDEKKEDDEVEAEDEETEEQGKRNVLKMMDPKNPTQAEIKDH